MFGFGHWELLIILAISALIFGAGTLPLLGAGTGKGIGNFKEGIAEEGNGKAIEFEDKNVV